MSNGKAYLVGAGPGHPGLITVRGRQALARADVVLYDRLVAPRLLDAAPEGCELIYVGKKPTRHAFSQNEINSLLIEKARGGANVVRLKGGDPYLFGRGGEEALALAETGIEFEIVPGVTAALAGAAYAGIPLTHRNLAGSLALVTGHEAADRQHSPPNWRALASWGGTLVFYMGMNSLRSTCERLLAEGLAEDTPAAVVQWAATPRQHAVTGTLATLADVAERAGLGSPALIIIGRVVGLRDKLGWFERLPLFGRRVVVTRAREQACEMNARLEALGAEVILLPAIRVEQTPDAGPLRKAVSGLSQFQWIAFTSVNAVEAFFDALDAEGLDARALARNKVCAIGPATARRLTAHGVRADVQPQLFTTAGLVEALAGSEVGLEGRHILCPRSHVAPPDLVEQLTARGASVAQVTAYRTLPGSFDEGRAAKLFSDNEVDWITFTSGSTVQNFFSVVDPNAVRASSVRVASIGPATSKALKRFGISPAVEAKEHVVEGLVRAIAEAERQASSSPSAASLRKGRPVPPAS